jgi:hypothetical protein
MTMEPDSSDCEDFIITTNEDGAQIKRPDREHINRARLRVDTRRWMAAKLAPKKYGDRVTNELMGDVGVNVMSELPREIDGTSRGFPAVKANSPPPQPNTMWRHSRIGEG